MTLVDISKLRESERNVERSDQLLRTVIDALPAVVTYIDRSGRYRFFNRQLCEWFDVDPESVQGRTAPESISQTAYRAVLPPMEAVKSGEAMRYEVELPIRYGGIRQIDVTYTPVAQQDGKVDGYVGLIQDVTDRKKVKAQLQALNESLEQQVTARMRTLGVLQDIAIAANEAQSVEDAVVNTLSRLCVANGWVVGHAWFPVEEEGKVMLKSSGIWYVRSQPHKAAAPFKEFQQITAETPIEVDHEIVSPISLREPVWLEDVQEFPDWRRGNPNQYGLRSAMIFPVAIRGEILAVLELFADQTIHRDERIMEVVPAIGAQLAHVIERKRLEHEIAEATSEQQRRLGRELHDSVSQEVSGISMIAESLRQNLEEQSSPHAPRMGELVKHLQNALDQIRRLSRGLLPVEVDADGLRPALEDLAENCRQMYSVKCEFHCSAPVSIESNDTATHLYRIAQEAAQNAVKHGHPKRIDITLSVEHGDTILKVSDDGGGFKAKKSGKRGSGHRIMQYRANLIGADLQVESRDGKGVVVTCRMRRKSQL